MLGHGSNPAHGESDAKRCGDPKRRGFRRAATDLCACGRAVRPGAQGADERRVSAVRDEPTCLFQASGE